ncbi:hypothetical protein CEK71_06680 [Methylovulum psychrotolerans]|uniref:Uncharacterized protein n=1 Tax=Methylovulum psychrotolerans TaxID=1704499 RepID=A0A1Z4BWW1_9GAMM|nr:hypothetical protein CEK71_06680 [Methylovulum psychrotolerans]
MASSKIFAYFAYNCLNKILNPLFLPAKLAASDRRTHFFLNPPATTKRPQPQKCLNYGLCLLQHPLNYTGQIKLLISLYFQSLPGKQQYREQTYNF